MEKIGLFYGSTIGDTEDAAEIIVSALGKENVDVYDVASAAKADLEKYDNLIFGASTWGFGELQDDWKDFIDEVKDADLSGKQVALFGTGDQAAYSDTFVDAIGIIYQAVKENGGNVIGKVDVEGYDFSDSEAVIDYQFIGLPLDNNNQSELTDSRINDWVEDLANHF